MTSDRIQRQVERFLDAAEQAAERLDWAEARDRAQAVLNLDPDNSDARLYLTAAERALKTALGVPASQAETTLPPADETVMSRPVSFVSGRYTVTRFLGEGGKKQVYLAHDSLLDRNVAFSLIKVDGLDETGRQRIKREAQAMGRLGSHPNIVSVFDMGEENGQPYIVTELMSGGDVEGLIEQAPEHRPELARTLEIATAVCRGLEFAHGLGIVHRDLKPGNVWLTMDGTAKLGDFGLAVALDKSRLTQDGMMVGTVSYMPPEQAMGGEVTPQSDLYSLGAMLYEMVTGRPPFVGDESVAIITQHLNTAPVNPSWHNPAVPPGLEALILRLLEKDASKRPASAIEVRQSLERLTTGSATPASDTPTADSQAATEQNPMYRRTFVGRESELRTLQGAFDAALSGQVGLVMVVGEPGIGKTSIIEQLATYAAIRGGKALVGHCYEEGSLSLPYLPFIEAMRSYVLAREPDGLKVDLGSGAGDVARIVSEIRDRLSVEVHPSGDPEDDRWRLLHAVMGFLRNASLVQPLLLVLEDLHDADRGTLDLLVHLARNLEGACLLIAGTYRDVEVDRQHPLSGTLADLRRINTFLRVPLRGLTADEVQRMMAAVAQRKIPWPFAELVHRQTEGNPLFVQEMLRYLVEEGLVSEQGNALRRVGDDSLAGRIPEGLRDVIGKRLSRLAEKTNQVLAVAAVMGREFRLDVLQRVAALDEEALYAALAEAKAVAVVEERSAIGASVSYRFTHAFFRQTLYEETIAPRRIRLHQQVARALEVVYGRRLEEHAAELAEHYAYSSDPSDLGKAVEYGELAAQRALSVYAYGEAARHLGQAIDVQEVLDRDATAKLCDLHLTLGEALVSGGEATRAVEQVAPEALRLAETLGDHRRASRACRIVQVVSSFSSSASASLEGQRWSQVADRYADEGTSDRAYADAFLAFVAMALGRSGESLRLFRKATRLALQLDDLPALVMSSWILLLGNTAPPQEHHERIELAEELAKRSLDGLQSTSLANTLLCLGQVCLTWGRREEAERHWQRAREIAARSRAADVAFVPLQIDALMCTLDGQLDAAVDFGLQLRQRGHELDLERGGRQFGARSARRALVYLGRAAEALDDIPESLDLFLGGGIFAGQRALCLAHMGRADEAQEILLRMLGARDMSRTDDQTPAAVLRYLLEAAVMLQDADAARVLESRMTPLAGLLHTEADMCYNIGRLLGGAAMLLGEPEKAHTYYEQAIEICTKVRFRPELALTRLELAELLLAHYPDERATALDHLDFAIAEFRAMKMQPSLERALRLKATLVA